MSAPQSAKRSPRPHNRPLREAKRIPIPAHRSPHMDTLHHEYARDGAATRLDALKASKAKAMDSIRSALSTLQQEVRCSDRDRLHAIDCIADAVNDMAWDAITAIENEISARNDAISAAEEMDLRRSSPVRI